MPTTLLYHLPGAPGPADTQPLSDTAPEADVLRLARGYVSDGFCVEVWRKTPGSREPAVRVFEGEPAGVESSNA